MAYGTSSTKRIIWTEPSGQVAVLYPIEAIENCIKDVPDGLSYHIVEDDDIPKNTFFERAWKIVDGNLKIIWDSGKSDYFFQGVMGYQRIRKNKNQSYTSGLRKLSD